MNIPNERNIQIYRRNCGILRNLLAFQIRQLKMTAYAAAIKVSVTRLIQSSLGLSR